MSFTKYPSSVYIILAFEICERFAFCGLRAMLSLYLRDFLNFSEKNSTEIYHAFYALCYFVPIFGAMLADSFYGRYRTIRIFSCFYVLGCLFLCAGALPKSFLPAVFTTLIALFLIGCGTGGIKPCVAALCGEQFSTQEQKLNLESFFSTYYFVINVGGFLGMICVPILTRTIQYNSVNESSGYFIGFGISAIFMILALLFFVLGKPFYTLRHPKDNIILHVVQCMLYAWAEKLDTYPEKKKRHWLDFASGAFSSKLINDIKTVLAILFVFLPLPLFWSLFDQIGSSWTFQAARTDQQLFGITILPNQMQVIIPLLSLVLIPLFDHIIYPALDKKRILENPLSRMVCGGCIAGFAFICAGYVETHLQGKFTTTFTSEKSQKLFIINALECSVVIKNNITNVEMNLEPGGVLIYEHLYSGFYDFSTDFSQECFEQNKGYAHKNFNLNVANGSKYMILINFENNETVIYLEKFLIKPVNKRNFHLIALNPDQNHSYGIKLSYKSKLEHIVLMKKQDIYKHEIPDIKMETGTLQLEVLMTDYENSLVKNGTIFKGE